jgi:methanogenic corrinoid protein MtbC1
MANDGSTPRGRRAGQPPAARNPVCGGLAPLADSLVRTIEGRIIPQLMLVHRVAVDRPARGSTTRRPGPDDVRALAELVLARDTGGAVTAVAAQVAGGVGLEAVYLDLLAPTARYLGDLWDQDRIDFVQVTLGLCRLQQVVHTLGPAFLGDGDQELVAEPAHRILLATLAGDQHSFGLTLVAEFFRRAGWDVHEAPGATREDLVALVRREPFAAIGLSVGCESRLDATASILAALRRMACNPQLAVLVGGPAFAGHPERVALVGADATAPDGRQATAAVRELLAARAARPT